MEFLDFERRLAEVMPTMIATGPDGVPGPSEAFLRLQQDVEAALRSSSVPPELQQMADALRGMAATLSDPEVARTMLEAQSTPIQPNPPIFDAIEDMDEAAVRAELEDWEINTRVGQYEATALYHAMSCMTGVSPDIMHLLLDAGADPRLGLTDTNVLHGLGFSNCNDVSPEDLAGVIRRCVEKGADLEQRSNTLQWTPLITAASEWNAVAVEALLMAGARINVQAGDVDGVCYAGADVLVFAEGHAETTAVLQRYMRPVH